MANRENSASHPTSRKDEEQIVSSNVLKLPVILPKPSSRPSSAVKESSRPSSAINIPKLPDLVSKQPSTPQVAPKQSRHHFSSESIPSKVLPASDPNDIPQRSLEKILQPSSINVSLSGEVLTAVAPEIVSSPEEPDDKEYDEDPIILIFLDKNAHDTDYRAMFKKIEHRRLFYSDHIVCMNDNRWTGIKNKKIFLIASGSMFQIMNMDVEQIINEYHNVDSIFIFCAKRERYEHLLEKEQQTDRRPTLKGIFTGYDTLLKSIEDNLTLTQSHLKALQYFASRKQFQFIDQYSGDVSSFFLMKTLVMDMSNTESAKNEMLSLCRDYYRDNILELTTIDKFQTHYFDMHPIWWYTSDSFVYKMLNMALQSGNIRLMYTFRFLIHDLSQNLRHLQRSQIDFSEKRSLMVFRGVSMPETELNAFISRIGSPFLANGYFSTTLDRNAAYAFLQNIRKNMVAVLFEININSSHSSCVFADVSNLSAFQNEKEVIFDIGLILKITEVTPPSDDADQKIYIIKMIAEDSHESEQQCQKYLNVMQSLEKCSEPIFVGKIIQTLGMYSWLREYCEKVLSATAIDSQDIPNIQCILSCQTRFLNNVEDADKYRSLLEQSVTEFPQIVNTSGALLEFNGELSSIGDTYEKLLLDLNTSNIEEPRKQFVLAAVYMNIGEKLMEEGAYDLARERYERAQKVYAELLPSIHPLLGDVCIALGNVYRKKNENSDALSSYEKAHILYRQWLPSHHPSIAYALSHLGLVHHQNGSIDKAYDLYKQALEIYSEILPDEHPNVQLSRYNGQCSKYEFVLDYYIKYPCF